MSGWKPLAVETLSRIRATQVKARLTAARLDSRELSDYIVKLLMLSEILERLALKLETAIYTGVASESLLESLSVVSNALQRIRHNIPPQLYNDLLVLQEEMASLYNVVSLLFHDDALSVSNEEVEKILREAEEIAKRRLQELRSKRVDSRGL